MTTTSTAPNASPAGQIIITRLPGWWLARDESGAELARSSISAEDCAWLAGVSPIQDVGELVCIRDMHSACHLIAAHGGIVPVAEVYNGGGTGSEANGPLRVVSASQALALAQMFARAPRVEAAARAAYAECCRSPGGGPKLWDAMGALWRAVQEVSDSTKVNL